MLNGVLGRAREAVSSRFGIRHSTFQIEPETDASCPTGACDAEPPGPVRPA